MANKSNNMLKTDIFKCLTLKCHRSKLVIICLFNIPFISPPVSYYSGTSNKSSTSRISRGTTLAIAVALIAVVPEAIPLVAEAA